MAKIGWYEIMMLTLFTLMAVAGIVTSIIRPNYNINNFVSINGTKFEIIDLKTR